MALAAMLFVRPMWMTSVFSQTVAPVQSPARPLGLPVHGPVNIFADDARSSDFYVNYMAYLRPGATVLAASMGNNDSEPLDK